MNTITSLTPFCTPRQLLQLVDWRLVADWAGDTRNRASRRSLRDPSHPAGQVVAQKLLQATGDLLTYAQAGGRYDPADLAALVGAGNATLVGLVGGRCVWLLAQRRTTAADPKKVPFAVETLETFQRLKDGEVIFGLDGPIQAAQMEATPLYDPERPPIGGRIVQQASRFFGNRGRE